MPASDRASPLRILTVSAFFESHGGGIEIVAGELARALGRRGHDSRLTAAALDPAPEDASLTAVPLAARDPMEAMTGLPMPLPNAAARRKLEREVREADALVIHDALYSTSLLASSYAERHRKPWILIQHIGAIPYSSAALRAVLGVANRVVTAPMLARVPQAAFISDAVRRQFAHLSYSRPPQLLFNGVDSALFRPSKNGESQAIRDRQGLPSSRPLLLFVGRFVEKKGLSILHRFAALRPDCDLLMVGSGPIDPAGWNRNNVRVLGRKSRLELAELYRACDALILPSAGEGYPLVIQEAMATGLRVYCGTDSAAADPDGARFLTGLVVDLGDPERTAHRFADAIKLTNAGPDRAAAAYARNAYDWDRNAEWLVQTFSNLAS